MPFLKAPAGLSGIVLMTGRQLDVEHGMVSSDVPGELEELVRAGFALLNDDEAVAVLEAAAPPAPPADDDKKPSKK